MNSLPKLFQVMGLTAPMGFLKLNINLIYLSGDLNYTITNGTTFSVSG